MFPIVFPDSCLYLTPEEGLSTGATILIVYEFEKEEVEEGYERRHAEPEDEGQPRVSVGHVFLVGQDGLQVQRVPQVLQVPQVCGNVQERRDGLGHHHGEGVAFDLRGELHGFVEAAGFAGVQLHGLLLLLHRHVEERLPVRVQQHRQVDQVPVVVDPSQGVAVVQDVGVRLELKVLFRELKAAEAERHALHGSVGPRCHQHLAASFLQSQGPECEQLQDLSGAADPLGPQVLGVHGGVAAEAVVGEVEAGFQMCALLWAQSVIQQGGFTGG